MKVGSVPQLLQFVAIILFGFLIFYITSTWIGSGYRAHNAIEEASLIYSLSTSANALSVMDEGYVIKELSQKYNIEILQNKIDDKKTNFYVKVFPVNGWSGKDFMFSTDEKSCGVSSSPIITAGKGEISFFGRIQTDDPCYKLSAEIEREGKDITIIIHPKKDNSIINCEKCAGAIKYSGKISNLDAGTYKITIVQSYEFRMKKDITLASESINVKEGATAEESSGEEKRFYLLTTDVTPTILQNADCIKIVKEPNSPVKFEKCTKSMFSEDNNEK